MTTESLIELVHSRLLPVLMDSIEQSAPIDLQDVLLRLTFDNICMMAFGVDPGCLRPALPKIPFARAFELATEVTVLRFVTPTFIWKVMRSLNIGTERELKNSIKEVDQFANNVICRRKKELSLDAMDDNKKARSDLLTVFMNLKDDDGKPFLDKFLRDICVNFILAGRDTSSVALGSFGCLIEIPTPDEVKKMEYLQAALSEALRLYPSVPLDHKEVVEDDVLPDGTIVKMRTKVLYAIYSIGRMESLWGKDCREFKPERCLRDRRFMSKSAYKFAAFNGRARLCLGKDFAYYQMKFTAASIIYWYRVKVMENHLVVRKLALTMYMKYGLMVELCKRNEAEILEHFRTKS
ncbi:hypothetical protein Sjap_014499 [Stephania japonica]|uniref:Cytochrome P450 n=1 Tax=Stephania japonica TaxID=461633 RepID=A0AAP0NQ08_9MAGN